MNVLCAWPAPSRAHDAVVVLRHTTKTVAGAGSSSNGTPIGRPSTPLLDPEKKGDAHKALVASPDPNGHDKTNGIDDDDDDDEDIVPREGLSRSGSKKVPEGAHAENSKKTKRKTWLGVFGGGGNDQKEARVLKKYWRFVGFNDDPRVRAMLDAHHAKLESKRKVPGLGFDKPSRSSSVNTTDSGTHAGDVQHGIAANHPTLQRLGTNLQGKLPKFHSDDPGTPLLKPGSHSGGDISPLEHSPSASTENFFTAPEPPARQLSSSPSPLRQDAGKSQSTNVAAPPLGLARSGPSAALLNSDERVGQSRYTVEGQQSNALSPPQKSSSQSSSSEPPPEMPPLARITTDIRTEAERSAKTDGLKGGDFRLAEDLHRKARLSEGGSGHSGPHWESKLDDQLGPWRFDDAGTDMVEDNAFIFTNESLPVAKRRKHFASVENRKKFVYDPDVVYGASFFTDAFDFNTFNLSLGPVGLNVAKFFKSMPVRYTLRAASEEPTFCTISFQLVD